MAGTSSPVADTPSGAPDAVRARLEKYYTRYYRDTLGIPGWRGLVAVRLADQAYEGQRLARLELAAGHPVRGCRLLNVGCGTGGFNVVAEHAGGKVWGVDSCAEAVAIAAARVAGGRIVCARAESLPFPDRCFDLVYCFSTLEHVEDAPAAVREMFRVLRPDGALYLHTPNRWACFESHYKVFLVPVLPPWAVRVYLAARRRPSAFFQTLRLLTLAECRRIIETAGGHVTRVLDGDATRPVGGPLWPLVRLYYRLFGIHLHVELIAARRREP